MSGEQGTNRGVAKTGAKRNWSAAAMERRIKALEGRMSSVEATLAKTVADVQTAAANSQEILTILTGVKTWGGYARKYAPHVAALVIGGLISGGYISAETGKSFSVLFGL